MLSVIVGYGNRIRAVLNEPVMFGDLENYVKNLYIRHKSQEIYIRNRTNTRWIKPEFTMKVSGQQMHPIRVSFKTVEDSEVPAEVLMKHLIGAL